MNREKIFTDLSIFRKDKNNNLKKYFDSLKRNLPTKWSWIKDKLYVDNDSFLLIEDTIFIKTPYLKRIKSNEIYYGIFTIGLTDECIIILKIDILNLINNEDLSSKYSKEEKTLTLDYLLKMLDKEILKENKHYEKYHHKFEFGGPYDENSFKNDIRDERSLKFHSKSNDKIYFFNKGKEAKHFEKKIIYFTPNSIALSLNLMKKSYKRSKELLKILLNNKESETIKLGENDKKTLYDFFEEVTTSIIFSYISVESFANAAIPEDFIYERINDKRIKESLNKENIERWLSTSQKISEILPIILNTKEIKKEDFWTRFKELEKIRNEIVHQKTVENGTILDSELFNKLLSDDIFKKISSSLSVIKFFYDYDNAHPYFPLGLGVAKFQVKEIENINEEFGGFKEIE